MENMLIPGESHVAAPTPYLWAAKSLGQNLLQLSHGWLFVPQNRAVQYGSHQPHMNIKFKFIEIK